MTAAKDFASFRSFDLSGLFTIFLTILFIALEITMIRFDRRLVLVAAVSGLTLFGCGQPQNTASSSAPETSTAANSAPTQSTSTQTAISAANPEFEGLRTVINNTRTDVNAGNFEKAKSNFSQLEGHWSKVEDGVKAKSSDTYNAIEDTTDKVNEGLKANQPNKDEVLSALSTLETNVNNAAKL